MHNNTSSLKQIAALNMVHNIVAGTETIKEYGNNGIFPKDLLAIQSLHVYMGYAENADRWLFRHLRQ